MQQASVHPHGLSRRRVAMVLPLLGSVLWHTGAAAAGGRLQPCRATRPLMGTQVDIVAEGPDGPLLRHAVDRAYAEMQRLEALMSRYQPQSVVSRIHLAAGVTPVGTPPEVIQKLSEAMKAATAQPEVKSRLDSAGGEAAYLGTAEFTRFLGDNAKQWSDAVKLIKTQ